MKFAFLVFLSMSSLVKVFPGQFAPFEHDLICKGNGETTLKITYDKTKFLELGRAGEIQIEINTGIAELIHMGSALGLENPYRRTIRRVGPAGQVGNLIRQDRTDPFIVEVDTGFTTYDVYRKDGQGLDKTVHSFISHLNLARVRETGFHGKAESDTREYIELSIRDDFGIHRMKFESTECETGKK